MTTASLLAHQLRLPRLSEQLDQLRGLAGRTLRLTPSDLLDCNKISRRLTDELGCEVLVTGQAEQRLVMISQSDTHWLVANLAALPLSECDWPTWFTAALGLAAISEDRAVLPVPAETVNRIRRPKLLVAALYHPEFFPLPRFPLGISDVARAARRVLCGHVELMDMQLGDTIDEILERAAGFDVLGVSATFGQHDLESELLERVFATEHPPLVIAGGSLTVRNERQLLERFPRLLIARGAGETTIQDVIGYLRHDRDPSHIRGVGYNGAARGENTMSIARHHSGTVPNRDRSDILPELDLLARTFTTQGVAQLEASRGCTNFCSFCPRGHKGAWSGTLSSSFEWIVSSVSDVLEEYPGISRTVHLVDEEFIGRGEDAVERALAIAHILCEVRLKWETSCRIDQVVRHDRDRNWHSERAQLWRELVARGLKRCLFGVESGVTSILERFNKETDSEQNVLAIRTLSALGVPTRYTYITFDQLMTFEELQQTAAFQARRDLVLRPLPQLSVQEIVDGVRDPDFVAEHALGRPFYAGVSYMLVSMECLTGAAYTNRATAAGLVGAERPAMGSAEARFADWRIGVMSHHAQLWIDRNFALDYTMKSLEKILSGHPYELIRQARVVFKDSAYTLLTAMIAAAAQFSPTEVGQEPQLARRLVELMNRQRADVLIDAIGVAVQACAATVPAGGAATLIEQHRSWLADREWQLINASENCE